MSYSLENPFSRALVAGAVAGTTVDLSLYPIDTLKTRLQSRGGFAASGGFRNIYAGAASAALGAAPGAALFFVSYEWTKDVLSQRKGLQNGARAEQEQWIDPVKHMAAASVGEVAACAVRVPTEVVKQRAQAMEYRSSPAALAAIIAKRKAIGAYGVFRELYRGWNITVMREVPFTIIQFPLWEAMKEWRTRTQGTDQITALDSAVFGSLAGAVAAGITTPLDVLKTRMMLSRERQKSISLLSQILKDSGPRAFFAGIGPRILWISAGGFIFLGSYQYAYNSLASPGST